MRAEFSRRRGAVQLSRTMPKRAQNAPGQEGGCEGGRGLYVKGGRARCYLACSPDEISASSFRPSFPLLPRSSPSESSFLVRLLPLCALSFSPAPTRISPRRSCKAKTFSARAIVRLLIALGFPLPAPAFSFPLI